MKKILAMAAIIAVVLSLAACSGSNTKTASVKDYYPSKVGTHLQYQGSGNEFAAYDIYVEKISGDMYQYKVVNDATTGVNVYKVTADQAVEVYSSGEYDQNGDYLNQSNMNQVVLQGPLTVGTSWTLDDGTVCTIKSLAASVTVPYGTFDALEVTCENDGAITSNYYAKDIGLIKSIFSTTDDPNNPVTSELVAVK